MWDKWKNRAFVTAAASCDGNIDATYNRDGLRFVASYIVSFLILRKNYSVADENELILVGYLTFLPTKESAIVIQNLYALGVTVKVLTGDNEFVLRKYVVKLGLTAIEFARWCYQNTH